MITYRHGTITYTVPRGLDRRTLSVVEYAAAAYGFLLNAEGAAASPTPGLGSLR